MENEQTLTSDFQQPSTQMALNFVLSAAAGAALSQEQVSEKIQSAVKLFTEASDKITDDGIKAMFQNSAALVSSDANLLWNAFPKFDYDLMIDNANDGATHWLESCQNNKISNEDFIKMTLEIRNIITAIIPENKHDDEKVARIMTGLKIMPMMIGS